jgi:hypothetical protein
MAGPGGCFGPVAVCGGFGPAQGWSGDLGPANHSLQIRYIQYRTFPPPKDGAVDIVSTAEGSDGAEDTVYGIHRPRMERWIPDTVGIYPLKEGRHEDVCPSVVVL